MDLINKLIVFLSFFVFGVLGEYQLILNEEFDKIDPSTWEHEITAWGGGNGEFEIYTDDPTNTYVRDGTLFIRPTPLVNNTNPLTKQPFGEDFLTSGTLNLTEMYGGCTFAEFNGCLRTGSNDHIILPIMSGRMRTRQRFSFKYGRVEVVAKMPVGDWLWPAIWLLPEEEVYGGWPRSGEIDMVESRGNRNLTCFGGQSAGVDKMGSALHWGPVWNDNKYHLTVSDRQNLSFPYADNFHTYRLDWDENGLRFYVDDGKILNVPDPLINENKNWKGFWDFGKQNGGWTVNDTDNPWNGRGLMAPFDQEFHLIVNVAVGGTGGYFPDDCIMSSGVRIPWNSTSKDAPSDFWNARRDWLHTWQGEDAALQIKSIKVWQELPPTRPTNEGCQIPTYKTTVISMMIILCVFWKTM